MCARPMGIPERSQSDLLERIRSWVPGRGDLPSVVSREYWMPDHSCRMCYECDSRFTVFNRRHHCRSCGRLFCSKCMQVVGGRGGGDDAERVKFCRFCFRAIGQESGMGDDEGRLDLPVPPQLVGFINDDTSKFRSFKCERLAGFLEMQQGLSSPRAAVGSCSASYVDPLSPASLHCSLVRSDEEDAKDTGKHFLSPSIELCQDISDVDTTNTDPRPYIYRCKSLASSPVGSSPLMISIGSPNGADESAQREGKANESVGIIRISEEESEDLENTNDCTDNLSIFQNRCQKGRELLDFENNGLIWFPPPAEHEEDDVEDRFFEYDDEEDNVGETGVTFSSSSFSSESFPSKERSNEGQKELLRAVVQGHFQALVLQLLKGEGVCAGNEDGNNRGWMEIVVSLAWQAANFVRPDTSRGGSMDPCAYVKIKCVASGRPSESTLVKGLVCTKNIKHKRMTSQYKNPKLLLLGGSLEYQRVPNMLASFDTLLQQEIEHLKMTVAKIDAHRPNVLLVEKSVSSYAQDYLLEKEISLVLNVKRPLLERIARCTGANIVPSIDMLTSTRLGHCECFRLERVSENCASSEQPTKKYTKTLMYFEGCPRRLGCTVILRGASRQELKKVKHVVQYAVFAAYHLSLETSFLADEGASLPKSPMKSPIVIKDRLVNADSAISLISDQVIPITCEATEHNGVRSNMIHNLHSVSHISTQNERSLLVGSGPKEVGLLPMHCNLSPVSVNSSASLESDLVRACSEQATTDLISDGALTSGPLVLSIAEDTRHSTPEMLESPIEVTTSGNYGRAAFGHVQTHAYRVDEYDISSEYFSAADNHQSILVSLSSRCLLKGTVCERSLLFRIKFYGGFDKPLGRYLRDDLFDQRSCCQSCNEPAETHVRCYTHQQGSLTISVRRLSSHKLSGARDGKIWMWHRCLKCARKDGVPPPTRRVVMSDAAWGLSFGKFLELSFSNHATANRVASCGHSLQKDCLRFYGFGSMVAFFRYSPVDILSVKLPPSVLEFKSHIQLSLVKREAMEVSEKMELIYADVLNALQNIEQRISSSGREPSWRSAFCDHVGDLKDMLMVERSEYEVLLNPAHIEDWRPSQDAVDILQLNRLRCCLLFEFYMWDRRLHLLDACFKTDSPIIKSDPSLPDIAILAKLKDWRRESLYKDDSTGCSLKENNMNSTLLNNLVDHILPKQEKDLNSQLLESSSSENMKDLKVMTVDARLGTVDLKLANDCHHTRVVESVDGESLIAGTTSESLSSPASCLSDHIDSAWTGTDQLGKAELMSGSHSDRQESIVAGVTCQKDVSRRKILTPTRVYSFDSALRFQDKIQKGLPSAASSQLSGAKSFHASGDCSSLLRDPIPSNLRTDSLISPRASHLAKFNFGHTPSYISSISCLVSGGVRLLLPQMGHNNIVVAVYDNEPTSMISYALSSKEYEDFIADKSDVQGGNDNDITREDGTTSFLGYRSAVSTLSALQSFSSLDLDDIQVRSYGSDEVSSSRGGLKKSHHVKVSFSDESYSAGQVKFSVTCYFAKQFNVLRQICCPSEMDFLCSLSRCKRWNAQGGKSNVYFAKTFDERLIVKQVTKTELDSFEEFAPEYFKYLMDSHSSGSPTCLAKVLGIYHVSVKHLKGGKDLKMDLMVMENLFFGRSISRVYDLKGSARARYNPDTTGGNKVLLDLNLLEALRTKPIFLGSKAKRSLERAIWNDTFFLASVDVIDYSLLVGVDEERKELVMGIIDFMRQYTWDKHLETWVKASGILGGPKNESPTVISPKQYKKRFRKAMSTYFLTVPDLWSS